MGNKQHSHTSHRTKQPSRQHPPPTMKTTTLTALFLMACPLVASALADSGESERRPGGPSSGGGANSGAPSAEEDDVATLFNSINGQNGILNAQTFSGLSAATQGQNGLKKLTINLSIKVVLVKIGGKTYSV